MRILVFGGNGMLGHKLVQRLGDKFDVWCTLRERFIAVAGFGLFDPGRTVERVDVTDVDSVRRALESAHPDVVINAVGLIKQVPVSKDVLQLSAVNSVFPKNLALLGGQYGFRLVSISTDCVFSGSRGMYGESDICDADDLYGISKFLGEVTEGNCLTLRTSIIARELETKHSIVEWFLSNRGRSVKGYREAIYTGFTTLAFAEILSNVIENHPDLRGLYHVSSEPITKFDLLHLLNKHFDANVDIEPDNEYSIDRSLDSALFRQTTGFVPRSWDEMVAAMAADQTPYDALDLSSAAL